MNLKTWTRPLATVLLALVVLLGGAGAASAASLPPVSVTVPIPVTCTVSNTPHGVVCAPPFGPPIGVECAGPIGGFPCDNAVKAANAVLAIAVDTCNRPLGGACSDLDVTVEHGPTATKVTIHCETIVVQPDGTTVGKNCTITISAD